MAVRPDAVDQFALGDHAAGILDQKTQRLEGFAAEGDLVEAGGKDALDGIEAEWSEAIGLHRTFNGDSFESHDFALSPLQIVSTGTIILPRRKKERDFMRTL